jgi:hypothetical protein
MYDGEKWTQMTLIPHKFRFHAAVELDNNRALLCGGVSCFDLDVVALCYIYSASNDTWIEAPPMFDKKWSHRMFVSNGLCICVIL